MLNATIFFCNSYFVGSTATQSDVMMKFADAIFTVAPDDYVRAVLDST